MCRAASAATSPGERTAVVPWPRGRFVPTRRLKCGPGLSGCAELHFRLQGWVDGQAGGRETQAKKGGRGGAKARDPGSLRDQADYGWREGGQPPRGHRAAPQCGAGPEAAIGSSWSGPGEMTSVRAHSMNQACKRGVIVSVCVCVRARAILRPRARARDTCVRACVRATALHGTLLAPHHRRS